MLILAAFELGPSDPFADGIKGQENQDEEAQLQKDKEDFEL